MRTNLDDLRRYVLSFLSQDVSRLDINSARTVIRIHPKTSKPFFSRFSEAEADFRWSYDYPTQIMTVFRGSSYVHEAMAPFIIKIEHAASDLLYKNSANVKLRSSGKPLIVLFPDDPSKTFKTRADGGISVPRSGSPIPTLVIEVDFSQSDSELISVAKKWLLGSSGRVRTVLLVKFKQPSKQTDFGDVTKWSGYIETWVRNTSNVETNGPSNGEAQSANANEHRDVTQKGDRFYFLRAGTAISPDDLNFKFDITDIVDPTMLPAIANPTLVVDFEEILEYIEEAISFMDEERKEKALKIANNASANTNFANADPKHPDATAAVDPDTGADVNTAATCRQ